MDGLLLKYNQQKHRVARLHYSADPDKNPATEKGKAWFEAETRKYLGGTSDLKWRREMEIDFSAGSGELVFPWFLDAEAHLCIDPIKLDGGKWNFYAGLDWGTRNPAVMQVVAENTDGVFVNCWELHCERITLREFARKIKECPYYGQIQWIAADPTIYNETVARKDGFTSIASMLNDVNEVGEFTIDKLMAAHGRSDETCINRFKNMVLQEPVRLFFFRTCENMRRELRNLKYPEVRSGAGVTEKIQDKDNHSWDALKYILLSHPSAANVYEEVKIGTIDYYNKVAELATLMSRDNGMSIQDNFNELYGQRI